MLAWDSGCSSFAWGTSLSADTGRLKPMAGLPTRTQTASNIASDLQHGDMDMLLARGGGGGGGRGQGQGQGQGGGSGTGQCDGSGSGQGKGKGYGVKDGNWHPGTSPGWFRLWRGIGQGLRWRGQEQH